MIIRLFRWMEAHPGKAGTLAGWYQQAMSIGMALILIPQIILLLPSSETGLWFTFQSLVLFFLILQFGLPITIARQVAYSLDAKSEQGIERNDDFIPLRHGLGGISDLLSITRIIFFVLLSLCLVLIVVVGEYILPLGKLLSKNSSEASTVWYLFGILIFSTLLNNRTQAFLEGLGKIYIIHLISGTHNLISGAAIIASLHLTHSMIVMAASQSICGLLFMFSLQLILHRSLNKCPPPSPNLDWAVLKHLIKVAFPFGIIHLGRSLVTAIQVPLIGFILGAETVSPFYIAQKIGHSIRLATNHITQPQMPFFTRELAAEKWSAAHSRIMRTVTGVWVFSLATQSVFYLLSPWFVNWWIGPDQYIERTVLFFMAFNFFVIASTQVWTAFTIAGGHNPFVISILLSGLLNIILCALLVGPFGILGIVWSGLLSGLATIYWFGPYHGIKLLKRLKEEPAYQ